MPEIIINDHLEYRCDTCEKGLMQPIQEINILTLKQLHICPNCKTTVKLRNTYPTDRLIKIGD